MLPFEMSSPVVLSSEASEPPTNRSRAADMIAKIPLITMTSLVADKVLRTRKCKVLGCARRFGTFECFQMVFLVATVQNISI